MINLTKEDVKEAGVVDLSLKKFVKWLRIGCEDYFLEENRSGAWDEMSWFIGSGDDIISDFADIYDVCPPKSQSIWRDGIAVLLKELPTKQNNVEIVEFLLLLAGRIQAYEILEPLPGIIGNGFFGYSKNSHGVQNLFDTSLHVVAGMAGGGKKELVIKTMELLITSKFFPEIFSGFAFVALCRSDPQNIHKHVVFFRKVMSKLYNNDHELDLQELGWQICDYVNLPLIIKMLIHLKINGYREEPDDKWILSALFKGEQSAFVLKRKKDPKDKDETVFEVSHSERPFKMTIPGRLKTEIIDELNKWVKKDNANLNGNELNEEIHSGIEEYLKPEDKHPPQKKAA